MLKYDIYSTYGAHKDLLQDLLLFHSAKEDKPITLAEYVAGMQEGQENIFFASGDTVARPGTEPERHVGRLARLRCPALR